MCLVWTACSQNNTSNQPKKDGDFYVDKVDNLPKILAHYQVDSIPNNSYLIIVNNSSCSQCSEDGIKRTFEKIQFLPNIYCIFVTEKNDFVDEQLENLKLYKGKIMYDTDKFLPQYGFSYPQHLILKRQNDKYKIIDVLK